VFTENFGVNSDDARHTFKLRRGARRGVAGEARRARA